MADKLDVRLDGRSIDLQYLDITSYLSAPNLCNSCNKYQGAVYHIFIDFIDRGCQKKHTAFYNLTMHTLDKIVENHETETGKMHKVELSKLKIQMVIELSISAGLLVNKEYKCFCKWNKHLNIDHKKTAVKNSLAQFAIKLRLMARE